MDCYIVVSGVIAVEKMNTILELWLNRVFAKQSSSQIYIENIIQSILLANKPN